MTMVKSGLKELTGVPLQQIQNICITFVQRWTNVEDVGPSLYKINVLQMVCVCWDSTIKKELY